MSMFKLLGAVAVLSSLSATPVLAQAVVQEPGYCAFFYPNANCQNKGPGNPLIMSNPPPKGMIGRAVKPLAWHRSERASTDPAITAALTRFGTESGPPGIGAGRLRDATGTLDVRVPTKPFSIGHEVGRK